MIPIAIDVQTGELLPASRLAEMSPTELHHRRRLALASGPVQGQTPRPLQCIGCRSLVYPRKGGVGDRPHWVHRGRPADTGRWCPYDRGPKLDEGQINRRIFQGRQESKEHQDLVRLLHGLAIADPKTAPDPPNPDTYFKPDPDKHGLFPDVRFTHGGRDIVIEAQLATIALVTIDRRRSRYEKAGVALLWVMRRFDPSAFVKSSALDVAADQIGIIFDLPQEVVTASQADGLMRLRRWRLDAKDVWLSDVVMLAEAIQSASPEPWHGDFKRRWIAAAAGQNYFSIPRETTDAFNDELVERTGLSCTQDINGSNFEWMRVANILIAIESGVVTGYGYSNLTSVVNATGAADLVLASGMIRLALSQWRPKILEIESVRNTFKRNKQLVADKGAAAWTREGDAGLLLRSLFPELVLQSPT